MVSVIGRFEKEVKGVVEEEGEGEEQGEVN
jgi:hypothetical protein